MICKSDRARNTNYKSLLSNGFDYVWNESKTFAMMWWRAVEFKSTHLPKPPLLHSRTWSKKSNVKSVQVITLSHLIKESAFCKISSFKTLLFFACFAVCLQYCCLATPLTNKIAGTLEALKIKR